MSFPTAPVRSTTSPPSSISNLLLFSSSRTCDIGVSVMKHKSAVPGSAVCAYHIYKPAYQMKELIIYHLGLKFFASLMEIYLLLAKNQSMSGTPASSAEHVPNAIFVHDRMRHRPFHSIAGRRTKRLMSHAEMFGVEVHSLRYRPDCQYNMVQGLDNGS